MDQPSPSELWDEFEKSMIAAFPFLPKDFTRAGFADSSRLSEIVQQSVSKIIDRELKSKMPNSMFGRTLSCDIFETHRSVIVRIRVPEGVNPRELDVAISSHKVRIKQPSGEKRVIALPRAVNPRRARSMYKDGILELRLPKTREPYYPHYVDG